LHFTVARLFYIIPDLSLGCRLCVSTVVRSVILRERVCYCTTVTPGDSPTAAPHRGIHQPESYCVYMIVPIVYNDAVLSFSAVFRQVEAYFSP